MWVGGLCVTWSLLPKKYHHRDLLSGSAKRFLITTCRDVLFIENTRPLLLSTSVQTFDRDIAFNANQKPQHPQAFTHIYVHIYFLRFTYTTHTFFYVQTYCDTQKHSLIYNVHKHSFTSKTTVHAIFPVEPSQLLDETAAATQVANFCRLP